MYSEELINYLYKYDMPTKRPKAKVTVPSSFKAPVTALLKVVKKAYAAVPVKFKDE